MQRHLRLITIAAAAAAAAFAIDTTALPLPDDPAAALVITVTPTRPTTANANFSITWSGVPGAQSTDWIASYCLGAAEPAFGPNWAYTSVDPNWASGAGRMSLVTAQSECDTIEFRMYRDPAPYTLLGSSNNVTWPAGGSSAPRHIRIAYGANPGKETTISWTSADGSSPAVLQIGTAPGKYDLPPVTAAAAVTYAAADLCGAPSAYAFPGFYHHVLVTGLTPNTRYWFTPTQNGSRGNESTFVTGKPVGHDQSTRFAVYGDMYISGGTGAVDTAAHLTNRVNTANDLDFLLHVGDLGYGLGSSAVWEAWMNLIAPYSSKLNYLISIGNHEYDYTTSQDGSKDPSGAGKMYSPPWWNGGGDSGGECGVPTSRRFRMPANGNGVFWYSINVGNVHIAVLSSEHDPNPGAPMGDWLAQDLANVDRSATPWLMLAIHRPLVETEAYPGDFAVAAGLRAILEPLLLKWRVDVVLSGHYHSFQRSCAMANLTCVSDGGIVHYTTGAAGQSLDSISLYPSQYIEKTILGRYGYSILTAPNATSLNLQFFANDDNEPADDVWIHRAGR